MNQHFILLAASTVLAGETNSPSRLIQVQGNVKFAAVTNLSAISIHGESTALTGQVLLTVKDGRAVLEELTARVDPNSLKTGMELRDQHMRNKIFVSSGQDLPPLRFTADKAECPPVAAGQEVSCQVAGVFSLRGVEKPAAFRLKVKGDSGKGYRVSGEGLVKLSDFGIEPPCQLGVCVKNEVKVKLEFQGRESSERSQLALPAGERR
jgi:polyisoprenoid-binding protein YceI